MIITDVKYILIMAIRSLHIWHHEVTDSETVIIDSHMIYIYNSFICDNIYK